MGNVTLIDNKTTLSCQECGSKAYVMSGDADKAHGLYCLNCAYELDLVSATVQEKQQEDEEEISAVISGEEVMAKIKKYQEVFDNSPPSRRRCFGGRMCYCAPFEEDGTEDDNIKRSHL